MQDVFLVVFFFNYKKKKGGGVGILEFQIRSDQEES